MSLKTVAIVPSAGSGKRLGLKIKKPFVPLRGRPLVFYALNALERSRHINAVIVASEGCCIKDFDGIKRRYGFRKIKAIVKGGRTRFESVRNCLKALGGGFDIILIHDAARPFLDERLISGSIKLAKRYGGCIVAVPVKDTVKLVSKDLFVKKTLDRRALYAAQTPQAFRAGIALKAYGLEERGVTDDAMLIERMGGKVKILTGSPRNIKVTTKEDLKLAKVLINE